LLEKKETESYLINKDLSSLKQTIDSIPELKRVEEQLAA